MPASIELSGIELPQVNIMSREKVLKQYLERIDGRPDPPRSNKSPGDGGSGKALPDTKKSGA